MGFLSAITGITKVVLPHVIDFVRGGVTETIKGLDGDLAGENITFNTANPTRFITGLSFYNYRFVFL